jgi:Ethanolamine utilization cobalamin adenosyltransferase
MRYITEEDLRDLYRKDPFTGYFLEQGARLTPGARQFLMDKGIRTFDTENQPPAIAPAQKDTCIHKKLSRYMISVEALFLQTQQELLSRDVCLAQSVISLGKQFRSIRNLVNGKGSAEHLNFTDCTGIHCSNYSENLEDCFEITEFHMQLEKGREIILLHRLRCTLYELIITIQEQLEVDENGKEQGEDITGKIYQIINTLSQLICTAFGGKKCQRQG